MTKIGRAELKGSQFCYADFAGKVALNGAADGYKIVDQLNDVKKESCLFGIVIMIIIILRIVLLCRKKGVQYFTELSQLQ